MRVIVVGSQWCTAPANHICTIYKAKTIILNDNMILAHVFSSVCVVPGDKFPSEEVDRTTSGSSSSTIDTATISTSGIKPLS